MELSNANPASTWMAERLTLQGTVDFLGILFLFLYLLFFSLIIMEKSTCNHTENDIVDVS